MTRLARAVPVVRDAEGLRAWVAACRKRGERIAFVPTMGALHAGHLRLVTEAREHAARVVVSIFVNPTQFAAHEDLSTYPRTEGADLALLAGVRADLAFCPGPEVIYPPGSAVRVRVEGVTADLETTFRPQFFEGVATVVAKLFNLVTPDVALFGEKDFQQLQTIRAMTAGLLLPIDIVGVQTERDPDGLALSSRNAYLGATERQAASTLPRALRLAVAALEAGAEVAPTLADVAAEVSAAGFQKIDYIEVRRAADLSPLPGQNVPVGEPCRLLFAAWLGRTRLIDNMAVERP